MLHRADDDDFVLAATAAAARLLAQVRLGGWSGHVLISGGSTRAAGGGAVRQTGGKETWYEHCPAAAVPGPALCTVSSCSLAPWHRPHGCSPPRGRPCCHALRLRRTLQSCCSTQQRRCGLAGSTLRMQPETAKQSGVQGCSGLPQQLAMWHISPCCAGGACSRCCDGCRGGGQRGVGRQRAAAQV